jgi:hypothetical protein
VALIGGELARARTLLDESLALARRGDDSFGMTLALGSRSVVALLEDQPSIAARLAAEHLQRCREDGDRRGVTDSLVVAAALVADPRPDEAIVLSAAAASLGPLERLHRDILVSRVEPAARSLDSARRAALQEAGGRLSLARAVETAIASIDPIAAAPAAPRHGAA